MEDVPAMDSILTMLSLMLLDLLMDLAQAETLQPGRGKSQLSWLKPLMKQQVSVIWEALVEDFIAVSRED